MEDNGEIHNMSILGKHGNIYYEWRFIDDSMNEKRPFVCKALSH